MLVKQFPVFQEDVLTC